MARKKGPAKQREGKIFSIEAKILLGVIPITAAAMIIMTAFSGNRASHIIMGQVNQTAQATLDSNINKMVDELDEVRSYAITEASFVGSTYKSVKEDEYGEVFTEIINSNDMILGSGLWFEPNVYDASKKYCGPYWTKADGKVTLTREYETDEYDYLNQEYYTNAKALKQGEAKITDPYYDASSGLIMSTCSAPIYDGDTYIGCVTVDIELSTLQNIVSEIKMGKSGGAMLVSSDGTYISSPDTDKVNNAVKIQEDPEASLAKAGSEIMKSDKGIAFYDRSGTRLRLSMFFQSVPEVNWKLVLYLAQGEIKEQGTQLATQLVIILCIALAIVATITVLLVKSITRQLKKVTVFAGELSKGDFTVKRLDKGANDELGQMSASLNDMYDSNRNVIKQISDESERITEASGNLSNMAGKLTDEFDKIKTNMSAVNDNMMSQGAATEEVNASVEDVNASVQTLAGETDRSTASVVDIEKRAAEIEKSSREAYENATKLVEARRGELEEANEKSKVVAEIGNLANSIADIAEQINLLSLNASIEAARAGEHGRGFAVVASEINKLAESTKEAVVKIQETISGVQDAFASLSDSSNALIDFLDKTVTPDYDNFVNVGKQYGDDARSFGEATDNIKNMVDTISMAMDEVSKAIQNIAESTQETAEHSSDITNSINEVGEVVDTVGEMSENQQEIAKSLDGAISGFKLQ